jgi:tape measure domain-containing protein
VSTTIAALNVRLLASTKQFDDRMSFAGQALGTVRTAFNRATDAGAAYEGMANSVGGLKLAGAETLQSLQTTFAVARSELRRFARNKDVQVAIEFGREHLSEAWLKARSVLQRAIDATKIRIAAAVVADRTQDARAWLDRQRRQLTRPITARLELARGAIDSQIAAVRSKLEGLKQYRAVRIMLAAVNATKLPVQAALATLTPLRKLAVSGLTVALRATHVGIAVAVTKARAMLSGLASHGSRVAYSITGAFRSIASTGAGMLAVAGGAAAAGIGGLAAYSVKLAAQAEQARVSFTTMLGSAEKAKQLQAEINSFAASTPFNTTDLIGASKSLLAFGVSQEQIIPTMRTLGDLSAGLGIPLGDLAEIYGKAKVQGRLMMEDINQLTGRGIPVIQEFAKQFGVTEAEVRGLVESGKINFSHLQTAMASLTGEGGKFGGMMAAQSKTVSGLWSTMTDTVELSLTKVGETLTEKLDLRGVIGGITGSLSALADAALPVLEQLIGGLAQGGNMGERAGRMVLNGAEFIATGIAYAMNAVDLIAAGWRAAQAGVAYAIGGILRGINWMGEGIVTLLNKLPGVELEWTSTIGQMGDALIEEGDRLGAAAAENFDSFSDGRRVKAVEDFFDGVRANAEQAKTATEGVGKAAEQTALKIEQAAAVTNTKIKETIDKLREQVEAFGQTEAQKIGIELRKHGASEDQIGEATGLRSKLDALEAAKKKSEDLAQKGKSIFDETRTPMEKYEARIGELSELLKGGAIDWETYGRAVRGARTDLEKSTQPETPEAPTLFRAGSAEAARLSYDLKRGDSKQRDDLPKKQVAEQQETNRLLHQVARNTLPAAALEEVGI